jgi:hypothetical protein
MWSRIKKDKWARTIKKPNSDFYICLSLQIKTWSREKITLILLLLSRTDKWRAFNPIGCKIFSEIAILSPWERVLNTITFVLGLKARIRVKEDNDLLHYICFFFRMSVREMSVSFGFTKKLLSTNCTPKCASFILWHSVSKWQNIVTH